MKKIILMVCLIVLCFCIIGCQEESNSKSKTKVSVKPIAERIKMHNGKTDSFVGLGWVLKF